MDIIFSGFIFIAIFVGNATIFNFPLNIILPVLALFFVSQFQASIKQIFFVIFSTFIFLIYAVNLNVDYNPFYSLWIISYIVGYFTVIVLNFRINTRSDATLDAMFYVCGFLLLFFSIPMLTGSGGDRAGFLFGPNMLYRIVAFLGATVAGYLFFTNRTSLALFVSVFCCYVILLTGSRGGVLPMAILVVSWLHCHFKLFSSKTLLYASLFLGFLVLISGLVNFQVYRSFNFSAMGLDPNSSYIDAYIRLRPYLFFLYEPDRFSMIGIDYQTWMVYFNDVGFKYPHSLILELVMFYGAFGVFFSIYLVYKIFSVIRAMLLSVVSPAHIFYYSFFAYGIGTLLSGDMGDNGVFMGIVIAMSTKKLKIQSNG